MLTVCVRFCPENLPEAEYVNKEDEKNISSEESTTIEVFADPKNYIKINNQFNLYFDHILGFKSFQDDIFNKTIRSKANDFLNGSNCCVLTYGAKKSGKTYTMFGKLENKNAVSHLGLLPRTMSYIIEKLQAFYPSKSNQNENSLDWNLFISFGNIYNDEITDLMDIHSDKNIHLKKNKKTNEYYIKNLTQIKIKRISSFLKNLHLSYNNRKLYMSHKQDTNNNNKNIADRCHFFVTIKLNIYTIETKIKTKISSNTFNFIDCASYPQIDYKPFSETDRYNYDNLNFSFIQLNALMTRIAKKNDLTIDMRESLLTKLLYPIRRNNSNDCNKLLIMINCTTNNRLRDETIATLRFGNLPTNDPFILTMMEKQRHKIKKLETKNKELKLRIKQQKKERKELKNELSNNNNNNNNSNIELEKIKLHNQNKFQTLQSEYELLKLDFTSIKKELYSQKNQNFWIMEDYNELKIKYDGMCNGNNINTFDTKVNINQNEIISNLLKEMRHLREEKRENTLLLQAADNKLLEYEQQFEQYENDINERDDQINDLKNELEKVQNETNEMVRNEEEILMNKYNIYDDSINDNNDPQFMIRKLKMEIIKYKSDINSSSIVNKLRDKKHKLEEKVINLRTEKAKQLVMFNQERHKFNEQINELQRRIANMKCISKWKNLVHKRRIISIERDMERANRKMKENYSKNSEFRDQMHLLRKIAEQKFDLALKHKMNKNKKINGHYIPSPSMKSMVYEPLESDTIMNYEQLIIDTTADFQRNMVGLLPNNLKRIHEVIDQLTSKLMIKNGQLQELRNKYDTLNKQYIELQYAYDDHYYGDKQTNSTSSSKKGNNINKHVITNSSFGEINLSSILDFNKFNININEKETIIDEECKKLTIANMYSSTENIIYNDDNDNDFNDADVDTKQEENYLKSLTNTAHLFNGHNEMLTDSNRSQKQSKLKQFTFRARATLNKNNNDNHIINDEIKQKQKQLRLLQESLSLTFHIDNRKNTRIKLNISMTPLNVYNNIYDGLNEVNNKKFSLIIQHNISPDFERIIIPYENCTTMSFGELIIEYGILNLLHFNICLEENIEKYLDNSNNEYDPTIKKTRKKKDDKKQSGIWNMFKS